MNRLSLLSLVGALATLFAGCPIYSGDTNDGNDGAGGFFGSGGCDSPDDCGVNETCGPDGKCHIGDCTLWGCPDGYGCVIHANQTASCEPGASGVGGSSSTTTSSGAAGGPSGAVYCGNPGDCAAGETCGPDGTCQAGDCTEIGCVFGFACTNTASGPVCTHENPAACGADADCATQGASYVCVSGVCTAPSDLCYDQTQCAGGDKCVAGKCTPACTSNADCPSSYTCDTSLGICSEPAKPCSITNDCGSADLVCVDGACVPRSNGPVCDAGFVWVENGCIPNQSGTFVCSVDGTQDVCAGGSICLHHSCYISCEPPNETACENLSSFNLCKPVATVSGTHSVCASDQNLGGDCDPTVAVGCSESKICIDGFCK